MKILVVTSSYPRRPEDIAGRFVYEFCEHLADRGHDLHVMTWRDGGGETFHPDSHSVERVPYATPRLEDLFYGAGTPENLAENPLRWGLAPGAMAAMTYRLMRQVRERSPDIIVGHWLFPGGLLARGVGEWTGIPSHVVGHSGGVHLASRLPKPVAGALGALVQRGTITVPSQPLRRRLKDVWPDARCEVLPMGFVPEEGFSEGRGAHRRDWLCMGRLVSIKGVDLALRAFERADLPEDVTLHVAGDGPERARLERLALSLDSRVRFHGFVRGEARRRVFEQCGFALFPAKSLDDGRHEGLPVSLLEVVSAGMIPVIGTIPGAERFLVEPGVQRPRGREADRWADAVQRLASLETEKRQQMLHRGHQAVRPLTWPHLIERWEHLLANVTRREISRA